jgi:twitching motility protein PilT
MSMNFTVSGMGTNGSDPSADVQTAPETEVPASNVNSFPSGADAGADFFTILDLLKATVERKASDLHLTTGAPPYLRVDGELTPLNFPLNDPKQLKALIYSMMSEQQIKQYELDKELDFAYSVKSLGRFRVNVFQQRSSIGSVIRTIPTNKMSLDQLGLPAITKDLIMRPRGIILVTGPTGSGKSTSLAAMIDFINEHRKAHIMTVEDPIEFLHDHKMSLVNQREVGTDTQTFANALKRVLRQDPDVILVGELRDIESMGTAITAAETGHLVFATLHTNDAAQTIDRIIDVFPTSQQQQVRMQFANSLQAIFCQTLARRIGGGRVMAYELLIANNAVRNLVREGKIHQIPSIIETSIGQGMRTMNMSLIELVKKNVVAKDDARTHATNPTEFDRELSTS